MFPARNGLIAAAMATTAEGYAEREAALVMLEDQQKGRTWRITVGADKAYDSRDFIEAARKLKVTAPSRRTTTDDARTSTAEPFGTPDTQSA